MDQVLTLAIQTAFFAVFAVTLVRFMRTPTRLNRDVALVFASIAGIFVLSVVSVVWPERPPVVASTASILLLAEPYLVLRLIHHFRPIDRRIEILVALAFLASALLVASGALATDRTWTIAVVGYFVGASLIGTVYLFRAADRRAGASRTRLRIAAVATVLLALAVLLAGAASGASAGSPPSSASLITALSRFLALLAAVAFLAAFAPPPFLRRAQQRAVAFDLARGLVSAPAGAVTQASWQHLAAAARAITGAPATAVVVGRPRPVLRAVDGAWRDLPSIGTPVPIHEPPSATARLADPAAAGVADLAAAAGTSLVIVIPIGADAQPVGWLLAFLTGTPLFVEDDLALLMLLASLTARSIEREEALAERTTLISELRRTNDELARASAAKSDFLAAMSHELRTPLNSIIGFSELMLAPVSRADGFRPIDVADWAAHIHGAGLQLLDLINEVLDLARIEAGRLELRMERFDVAQLVARTMEAMRPVADRRAVALTLAPAAPVFIEADPARVRQIVYNLLSNAIKFSPQGERVDVAVEADGSDVRISVEDRGPGIAREDQVRLFQAFEQTAGGRAQAEGIGLGLALARQLADRHGGRVELVSDVGAGSRFTVVLPTRPPAPVAASDPTATSRPLVLVVEDDERSAELLRVVLEGEQYRVAIARDGAEGLGEMRRLRPAAVILDILLPGMDGWEVMQRARNDPATRDVPILVVSLIEDAELGVALGAVDFFTKPVDRALLLSRLRRVLGRPGAATTAPTVLAIDDEAAALEMYVAMLAPDGFRVVTANSGRAGVAAARRERPDVVLLDLTMPDLDGFKVAAALHADPATSDVPILVVTSRELDHTEKERLNSSVTAILRKGDGAVEGLRRWLAIHASGPDGAATDGSSRAARAATAP